MEKKMTGPEALIGIAKLVSQLDKCKTLKERIPITKELIAFAEHAQRSCPFEDIAAKIGEKVEYFKKELLLVEALALFETQLEALELEKNIQEKKVLN